MDDTRLLALLALLERMADDLHALRVATEKRRAPVTDAANLLRLIALHVGTRTFYCGDLIVHARLETSLDLRAALGSMNARKLGKLFASIEGKTIAGLRVVRVGADAAGIIWSVEQSLSVSSPIPIRKLAR